jgi:hypothetical protein
VNDLEARIRLELVGVIVLPPEVVPDWGDVRHRVRDDVEPAPGTGLRAAVRRRPLLALAAAVVLAAIPVSALAVEKGDPWWFLRSSAPGYAPAPGSGVEVVQRGSWGGHGWVLTAYRSTGGSLCFQVTATRKAQPLGEGGGACAPVRGVSAPRAGQLPMTVTFLSSGGGPTGGKSYLPRYIAGPVVGTAATVRIRLDDGVVISTPTIPAPSSLGADVRFYITQAPEAARTRGPCLQQALAEARVMPVDLVGLDRGGKVVAELRPSGASPERLAELRCRPPVRQLAPAGSPAKATRSLRTARRLFAQYGASATIEVGKVVDIPAGRPLPNGTIEHITVPSRCWRVDFSNGDWQGTCSSQVERHDPQYFLDYLEVEHVGRDVFVVAHAAARTGAPASRVSLRLSSDMTVSNLPVDGVVVFPVPRRALAAAPQRHVLTGYDSQGHVLGREHVFYRSCPSASARGGTC